MSKRVTFLFSLLLLTLSISSNTYSQSAIYDQPIKSSDYVPVYNPKSPPVTTSDGFDNFNLGTDFAEPHMSSNPNIPTQHFNAFNTNGAHYTLNGWDWFNITPNFGVTLAGDPVTAYDSLGTLYYENMYGSISGCYVVRSTNGGATWTSGVVAIAGVDKNWIAADQTSGPYANYVYTTMTASGGGNFARSTNQGASWQNMALLTPQSLPGMMVAVGPRVESGVDIPGGNVYVVTHSGSNSAGVYNFHLSTNGGVSFTPKGSHQFPNYIGTEVSSRSQVQNMRTRPYPNIYADNSYGPFRGRLYLIYASNNPSGNGNKSDIFLRWSTDAGTSWSAPKVVNDDPNSQANFQWMPSAWVDKTTGKIYVQWMDTRNFVNSDSCYIYASYSDDGGATFKTNQRISNVPMKINCSTCGGGGTPRYQGDYTAITSNAKGGMAVWHDFRAGTFGSYTAYFPDFALKVGISALTVNQGNTGLVTAYIPAVKLYSDTVIFSAAVTPAPAAGSITFSFSKNNITSFPDSTRMSIIVAGGTTVGSYTVAVTARGPNGTPVHVRNITLQVNNEIPVELVSFNSNVVNSNVELNWTTATETNNKGFEILRSRKDENSTWQTIGFVKGNGTSTEDHNYSYTDKNLSNTGKYYYKLKQVDYNGFFEYSHEVEANITQPLTYMLDQNYPNPFNPSTSIKYAVPFDSEIKITVLNSLGQTVEELVNAVQSGSVYEVKWNSGNYSSGVYFYKLEAKPLDGSKGFSAVRKMMLLK